MYRYETYFTLTADENVDVTTVDQHEHSRLLPDMTQARFAENAFYTPVPETLVECTARLLFMAVRWAKNLPSFANLPFRDQVSYTVPITGDDARDVVSST